MKGILITAVALLFCFCDLNGQVVVRCPSGIFRCVPTEESAIDSIHITPCDCDEPRNVNSGLNRCLRTITLCADNPVMPVDIDSFFFPYYALDPGSMQGLSGPNLQLLVDYMDPTGSIDPFSSADAQNIALVLRIDSISKCASFDAWVPMDEEYTLKVFREVVPDGDGDFDIVTIPASGAACGRTTSTCYTLALDESFKILPSNGTVFQEFYFPIGGEIADVNIKNIDIVHDRIDDLKLTFTPPWNTSRVVFREGFCSSSNSINIGFDMDGAKEIECPITNGTSYKPRENFYNPYNTRYFFGDDGDFPPYWYLQLEDSGSGNAGALHNWELEICVVKNLFNIYERSTHPAKLIGEASPNTITSTITVPSSGKITTIGIEKLDIEHTWIKDLKVSLVAPSGDTVILINRPCGNEDNLQLDIYDFAISDTVNCSNLIVPRLPTKPVEALSQFQGQEAQGDWTLIVEDLVGGDGGYLHSWGINIQSSCISNYASSENNILKGSIPRGRNYQVQDTIVSEERIIDNTPTNPANFITVSYKAGKAIQMQNEFQVENGQVFEATIEDCPE